MVLQEVLFKDGSRIYYKASNNDVFRRVIQYADGEYVDNAGKYYYLNILENFRDIGEAFYKDLEFIYNITSSEYNKEAVRAICKRIRGRNYGAGTEVFCTAIYLAMLDLEAEKKMPNWLGKALVLDSCKAVLLENMHYEQAAVLGTKDFTPVNHIISEDEPF